MMIVSCEPRRLGSKKRWAGEGREFFTLFMTCLGPPGGVHLENASFWCGCPSMAVVTEVRWRFNNTACATFKRRLFLGCRLMVMRAGCLLRGSKGALLLRAPAAIGEQE